MLSCAVFSNGSPFLNTRICAKNFRLAGNRLKLLQIFQNCLDLKVLPPEPITPHFPILCCAAGCGTGVAVIDRLNALLSFCYGKTAALFAELCETHGLDRQCGILHEPARYGGGLPYDLLEPFRAVFCDNLILKLVAKRTWKASDFQSAKNAVNLRPETMDSFEKEFEHALTLCYSRQYNSIRELMKRFAELIYQGIEQESDRPDLGSFFPVR